MKNASLYYLAAAVLSVAWLLTPAKAPAQNQSRTIERSGRRNLSINTEGNAERCADLKVTSTAELAQATESFILQKSEAPVLELTGMERGVLRVRGWDRAEYSVETCKIAVADNRAAAEQTLRSISLTHSAGHFTLSGPSGSDESNWQLYFFVNAPRDASLDLETKNGPISVAGISGNVKVRALNGPVSVSDSAGMVDVNTTNGPISFHGGGGEVHLTAKNGPISLNLAGDIWNGTKLEAHTDNGPVSLNMAETFRSGIRLETSPHSPISCRLATCQNAWTDTSANPRVMQINGTQDTIRVSTTNGPVSVNGGNKAKRII